MVTIPCPNCHALHAVHVSPSGLSGYGLLCDRCAKEALATPAPKNRSYPANHAKVAGFVLARANRRSRNPRGREAKAEYWKVADMPRPDSTRLQKEQQYRSMSPQSSWSSVVRNGELYELPGEGFSRSSRPR